MASNDYYNTAYNSTSRPYYDYNDNTAPSPLSRTPSGGSSHYPSTLHSSHYREEYTYPPQHQQQQQQQDPYIRNAPSQPYQGAAGKYNDRDRDDYDLEDATSIPMSTRKPKHDSTTSVAPILPTPASDDPFVRDQKPGRGRGRMRGLVDGSGGGGGGVSDNGGRAAKKGWFKGQITWVVYFLSTVQLIIFIVELVRNGTLTGSPIEIHPSFNPMVGPSPYVLINMGARYQPCMHNMAGVQDSSTLITWPCPNATSTTGSSVSCSLSELCGFSGVPNPKLNGSLSDKPAPNQWWRFIVPIFLHAGFIHIGFNLLLQLTLGRDIEKLIGPIRFVVVYFASGIFGFVLGGNFAASGIASTGASGSLFGLLAIVLIDLLYTWRTRDSPWKDLAFLILDVCIAFVLGLLPGLDNFSHIGGFLMGLVLGICILRSPPAFRARSIQYTTPFNPAPGSGPDSPRHEGRHDASSFEGEGLRGFIKSPVEFFKHRRGVWWIWWLVRVAALLGVLVGFILLIKNFYQWRTGCSWCKYLSCLPVKNWCNVGNLQFEPQGGNSKREMIQAARKVFEREVSWTA
ncbi:rhomboid-domain-containing protein [Polychaeton citri CBS 116435]|uniref:Rhomboid-type serine protease n=1 Tax=Polychaeton citri CBS 116435 TaxID=1314669 RepID=A0A9P4QC87_9PEZI|nr:rhomboid-domain-containing protein [Polychaeton citri CBS 116435]